MLTQGERQELHKLMASPQWAIVHRLIEGVCAKIQDERVPWDKEWDLVRDTLLKEGQLKGIQRLSQELYLQIGAMNQHESPRNKDSIRETGRGFDDNR